MPATAPLRAAGPGELLRTAAARWPGRPAVTAPSATLTYAALDAAADVGAGALAAAGAQPGATVAFALGHDAAAYVAPFACDRAGVTGLLLHDRLAPDRWRRQLARARPALCVADGDRAGRLHTAGGPVTPAARVLPLRAVEGTVAPAPADPDRAVVQLATSGSTGEPELVGLTGRGLAHVGSAYLDLLSLRTDGERTLVVLPLSSVAVLSTQLVTMVLVGGCAVLPADTGVARALHLLDDERITLLDAAPAWLAGLVRQPARRVPSWRTLVYGGEPMPPATVARLAARHPEVALYDVWGLTEAHGPVTARRHDPDRPVPRGSVGRPLAGLQVRAADAGGPLPPGARGELEVRGPSVARDLAAGRYHDGWLRTGDVGVVEGDGTVRLLDRRDGRILRGGLTISAREVEEVLRGVDGVDDAAVVSVPDGLGSEAVGAAVVAPTGSRAVLRHAVAEHVGAHAVPRRLVVLPELPRTATGKVDRQALRALLDAVSESPSGRTRAGA